MSDTSQLSSSPPVDHSDSTEMSLRLAENRPWLQPVLVAPREALPGVEGETGSENMGSGGSCSLNSEPGDLRPNAAV